MKVKFLPMDVEHEIESNETVLHLAQRTGLHIQSVCKGLPSCAECRVRIVDGEHHVLPPSKKEVSLIGTAHYIDLSRLSCQLRCFGDLTVDLSEQIEKEKRAQNKPRDRKARSDGQESKAVLGAIMDDFVVDNKPLEDEQQKTEQRKARPQRKKTEMKLDKRDEFYGSFYKEENGKKADGKSGEGRSKNRNKNKNRNRNRNRNKNRSSAKTAAPPKK